MARYSKGILGPVSGTVGTVIGGSWKGINYFRSRPSKRKRQSSEKQIDQQLRFSVVMAFCQAFTSLLEKTFKKYANDMSEFNAAFSYNINHALTGTTPDYAIKYSKALVSRGELPNAVAPAASATGTTVYFTWTDNSGMGNALPTDKAVLVAYSDAYSRSEYTIGSAQRSAGSATLDVTNFSGQTIQTWIAFLNDDGSDAASSIYTGELTVTPV